MSYTISQLRMEAPCGQSWEGMTPTERGRFCAECKLEVVDFTQFTDAQILEYFEHYEKGQARICGRVQSERLQGGISTLARNLGFGLLAGLAILTGGCKSQQNTVSTNETPIHSSPDSMERKKIIPPMGNLQRHGRDKQIATPPSQRL